MDYKRLTLVVPVARQTEANEKAKIYGLNTDLNTFTVPLSPTGDEPPTHYIACWGGLTGQEFGALRSQIGGIPGGRAVATPNDMDPAHKDEPDDLMPDELLAEMGLQVIRPPVLAFDVMSVLGLSRVAGEAEVVAVEQPNVLVRAYSWVKDKVVRAYQWVKGKLGFKP